MGFATVDSIINAASVNLKMQRLYFDKLFPSTTVVNIPHTSWTATGQPIVGAYPTVGVGNGRVTTSATNGAMVYGDAAGGRTMHLMTAGIGTKVVSSGGSFILCDRIADVQIDQTQAAASITGVDATSRLGATTAPGDGGQLWIEVVSALTGTAFTKTFTYTNQLGTGSQTTPNCTATASAIAGRSPNAKLWQSLAAADTGIRSLDAVASTTGGNSGVNIACCIVRPLAVIPITTVSLYAERDFVVEMPNIPKLYDSSCLFWIYTCFTAVIPSIFGELRICEN